MLYFHWSTTRHSLSIKGNNTFEEIFFDTFSSHKEKQLPCSLAEDFSKIDFEFLKLLSEKDYMKSLHYPDWVTCNPFHSIGVPAGLQARRRWLELDEGGIMTTRITAMVNGNNQNWTLWRHLLAIVDKDGDPIPKEQLVFVEKYCGPFALLEILCDDIGFNRYDLRMIQNAQDFAITKAGSLAKKPTPEMLEWVKNTLQHIGSFDDDRLKTWQASCDACYLLAPLVKKLKKNTYLDDSYARLITVNGKNEKLSNFVYAAFSDKSKAIVLKKQLSKPLNAGDQFFDPAMGSKKFWSS